MLDFIKRTKGFDKFFLMKIEERFETFDYTPLSHQPDINWKIIYKFFNEILPIFANYKSRLEMNVLFVDLISTYRGWRHSRGYPSRGQRTWSNASSSYRSNLVLREVKLRIAKKFYGTVPASEINMAYLAEDINSLWKAQWVNEWKAAKKKVKIAEMKNKNTPIKIDLKSMAENVIITDDITKKKLKANKKKRVIQKNVFTLGFDVGFTKFVLKNYQQLNKNNPMNATILTNNKNVKKQTVKKKVDIKVKKEAHKTKKKNKKSIWD